MVGIAAPPELSAYMERQGLRPVRLVHSKADATSSIWEVARGNDRYALKWVASSAPARMVEELARERDFYTASTDINCIPTLHDSHQDEHGQALLISYHEGQTLRQWLKARVRKQDAQGEMCAMVRRLFEALDQLFVPASTVAPSPLEWSREVSRVLSVLACSGPNSDRPTAPKRRHEWLLAQVLRQAARTACERNRQALHGSAVLTHGDLHMNNVMIDGELRVRFVDFGRSGRGSALPDIAYISTLLRLALAEDTPARSVLEQNIPNLLGRVQIDPESFEPLGAALLIVANSNSRFRVDGGITSLRDRSLMLPRALWHLRRAMSGAN